jgi:magnesium transporter
MDLSRGQRLPAGPGSTSTNTPNPPSSSGHPPRRRKNHRGGKKKKARRKSFAAAADEISQDNADSDGLDDVPQSFYIRPGRNLSTTSIESEALLDHR